MERLSEHFQLKGDPRGQTWNTLEGLYTSHLAWKLIGIPQEGLEDVDGVGEKDHSGHLALGVATASPHPHNWWKMDG